MGAFLNTAFKVYDLAWRAAAPLLENNKRLRQGLEQRTLEGGLPARADLWIQGASGGECYLTWEVLRHLENPFPDRPCNVLATTNTKQGMEILERAAEDINSSRRGITLQAHYFPFDAPRIMRKALAHVAPRAALILETEIWPGFLRACKEQGTRIVLANGRMNPRSLAGYLAAKGLFRELAPDLVLALSERDALRFGTLFGHDRVQTMPNIKFDRMNSSSALARKDNPLKDMLAPGTDFVVLGSVRREEEREVQQLVADLHRTSPKTVIGLFPRHMERIERWKELLDLAGLPWVLRSEQNDAVKPGTTVLWDAFGEMIPAYALASTAFVGGSLAPLGGQNFLEPLTCGVVPVVGPSWHNFSWVGGEIFDSGLALMGNGREEVLALLLGQLAEPPARKAVLSKVRAYIKQRRGGAKTVCKHIAHLLIND
ncbi:3-deoxy-D-manno-octulosonic acid transferase [Salidesulfovibrio onnuriiensis]|uniref:3-deoxy-D-manno-octulosonic acid transferase n=1 Tax=Salidesulfovibrio onnuriiensis TaxID=2583823 RepID=UPI0011C85F02|nr:glycosyltransferase N-terminal domain-containing protein [Salidesulfovibrio onnuriiensis]